MAVRVRCRCGQELQLRYGEWVYLFLGLVLLCVVLNSFGLLLLYLRVDDLQAGGGRSDVPRSVPPEGREDSRASGGSRETGGANGESKSQASAPAVERSTRPKVEALVTGAEPQTAPQTVPGDVAVSPAGPTGGDRPESSRAAAGTTALGAATVPIPIPIPTVSVPSREGSQAPVSGGGDAWVGAELWGGLPLVGEAPTGLRLHLLESVPGGLVWRAAFLLDPDARVRRRAYDRLRAFSARASAEVEASTGAARSVLAFALRWLDSPDGDPELARSVHGLFSSRGDARPVEPDLESVRSILASRLSAFLQDARDGAIARALAGLDSEGLDLVLLIDVSRSMKDALAAGRREAGWLLAAVRWALPGARVGLVLYRDEVVLAGAFSMSVEDQMARFAEVPASGGGDVPEGVDVALEVSLSLGTFRWRDDAAKHLVVFGDAPPRYDAVADLASLLRAAHEQGGFRLHTLGVQPETGRDDVPFFAELARAGGGDSRTIVASSLGSEVLRCVLGVSPSGGVEALARQWRAMFES